MTTDTKSLHDTLKTDIDTAYRAGDKHRTTVLKTLLSDAVKNATKTEKRLPTDAEIVSLLRKFVTNATETANAFDKQGRPENAAPYRAEVVILNEYLPAEVSGDDVRAFVEGLVASGDVPAGPKGLGDAVKALKAKYGDAFDGKVMTPIAKTALGN
ncbi:GatB/YqeY domain-containing protein [Rhizobium sp. BK176]|uniref:GatB/YqeY domain-containing protein n=1 Tax=Rhizobium sp. BK176 TaxID=2587071 RepID=UPI0021694460|nr:GatB/YqeY domain-containing protein [Rhizobium sp. BK176]MCS4088974.1 hypothetical protein [Rhizobium sp. BK176]